MDEVRRQAIHTSKAVVEQARAAKEIELSSLEVTKLGRQVATAATEQIKAVNALAKDGDEVRRVAKQTAQAISEQSSVVSALSSSTLRHTATLDRIVVAIGEQATGGEQIGQAVAAIRGRARELSSAVGNQVRSASPGDLGSLADHVAKLRGAYALHEKALASMALPASDVELTSARLPLQEKV
jgi:methyl-accepting chemotaxis protein